MYHAQYFHSIHIEENADDETSLSHSFHPSDQPKKNEFQFVIKQDAKTYPKPPCLNGDLRSVQYLGLKFNRT